MPESEEEIEEGFEATKGITADFIAMYTPGFSDIPRSRFDL